MISLGPRTPIVIATHNEGKRGEIADLLAPFGIAATSAGELGLPEPEETGATFIENAVLKSEAAARGSGRVALADDSGLSVEALGGEPGIFSARWAGPAKDFSLAMRLVEEKLAAAGATTPDRRRAEFVCALALSSPAGETMTWEGRVAGTLVWPPRGRKGFGYDPVFRPDGHDLTFGEMEPEAKHAMSHRARAFAMLIADCT
jgi:XTP/dITP diphosphohydrolase